MNNLVRWLVIVVLVAIYAVALASVLHPHLSSQYRAFYIDHTWTDYNPSRYEATPEQGITFSRPGLPPWVRTTLGMGFRDDWGRWTDDARSFTPGLIFDRRFDGDLCVDFTAHAVPWMVGRSIEVRIGGQEKPVRIASEGLTEYQVQFSRLQSADQLNFVLPSDLPPVAQRYPGSTDERRLGINLDHLRLLNGQCPATAANR